MGVSPAMAAYLRDRLTTVDQEAAKRTGPIAKGQSRLDAKDEKAAIDEKMLEDWRKEVYALDGYRCRCCGCKVHRTIELVSDQAQAHHVTGRVDRAVRYDVRNGLTLCRACHQRVTGAVNDKLFIFGSQTFVVGAKRYLNARKKVTFVRVA